MKLSGKLLIGLFASVLAVSACGGDFNPVVDTSGASTDTIGMMDTGSTGEEGSTGDETGGSTGDGTTGMDMGGSDDTGGSTGGTGEPEDLDPLPGDPCDPFGVETGPCQPYPDDHPDYQEGATYTCAPEDGDFVCSQYWGFKMGDPEFPWEQAQQGDMCQDDGGDFRFGACENAPCIKATNLLPADCVSPQYLHNDPYQTNPLPADFCCSTYCDQANPCNPGYTCDTMWDLDWDDQLETGICIVY